ncbi:hypothetical protein I7I50_10595 [Histoplasma capsulatum G186AR]|uniref:Uncharacterized protein n=1 Tax=Ajellomyces capsulatus TaxID=5037 RepID=A0A8H7Z4I9_AJECA|nr:hypothetical protein I7I52_01834 [Histoplasma capsulatum]QSS69338.1 hypothetical protein I7I50_10595 [Histoplasma capsulatum G186AR]
MMFNFSWNIPFWRLSLDTRKVNRARLSRCYNVFRVFLKNESRILRSINRHQRGLVSCLTKGTMIFTTGSQGGYGQGENTMNNQWLLAVSLPFQEHQGFEEQMPARASSC